MTTIKPDLSLECTCDESTSHGGYRLGCPRHMDLEMRRPPVATAKVGFHTVTYYHAEAIVSTPVKGEDGNVWSRQDYLRCDHNHTEREAADRCASAMAHRATKG